MAAYRMCRCPLSGALSVLVARQATCHCQCLGLVPTAPGTCPAVAAALATVDTGRKLIGPAARSAGLRSPAHPTPAPANTETGRLPDGLLSARSAVVTICPFSIARARGRTGCVAAANIASTRPLGLFPRSRRQRASLHAARREGAGDDSGDRVSSARCKEHMRGQEAEAAKIGNQPPGCLIDWVASAILR